MGVNPDQLQERLQTVKHAQRIRCTQLNSGSRNREVVGFILAELLNRGTGPGCLNDEVQLAGNCIALKRDARFLRENIEEALPRLRQARLIVTFHGYAKVPLDEEFAFPFRHMSRLRHHCQQVPALGKSMTSKDQCGRG